MHSISDIIRQRLAYLRSISLEEEGIVLSQESRVMFEKFLLDSRVMSEPISIILTEDANIRARWTNDVVVEFIGDVGLVSVMLGQKHRAFTVALGSIFETFSLYGVNL